MSCESCLNALGIDDAWPDCFDGRCIIPDPDAAGYRALNIRGKLIALGSLIGPEAVLRMYNASEEDIDMIAFIEETLRALKEKDGERG